MAVQGSDLKASFLAFLQAMYGEPGNSRPASPLPPTWQAQSYPAYRKSAPTLGGPEMAFNGPAAAPLVPGTGRGLQGPQTALLGSLQRSQSSSLVGFNSGVIR